MRNGSRVQRTNRTTNEEVKQRMGIDNVSNSTRALNELCCTLVGSFL